MVSVGVVFFSVMSNTPALKRSAKGKFSSSDPHGSLRALAIRRAEFTDGMLHLIREKNSHLPARGHVCKRIVRFAIRASH